MIFVSIYRLLPDYHQNNKNNSFLLILVILCFIYIIFDISKSFIPLKKPKGTICIVIDDFGFSNDDIVKQFFHINPNLTVAIIPNTTFSSAIGKYADSVGIETIIHMPMESHEVIQKKYPLSLNQKLNSKLVEERIRIAFNNLPNALGMNNHQGSKATENLQLMKNIARTLKKLDKFFLDSFTNPESRGFITMRRFGVPTQLRQIFLDHIEDKNKIKQNLDSLKVLSHSMDIAIGIGHVKPTTLEVLMEEIPKLESEGYKFIKLSQAVK